MRIRRRHYLLDEKQKSHLQIIIGYDHTFFKNSLMYFKIHSLFLDCRKSFSNIYQKAACSKMALQDFILKSVYFIFQTYI